AAAGNHPTGNTVILDLGGNRFAGYAHLQPGSLMVKVGQRVRRGQRLARLGNSGVSSEPHLHFQICDRPSILGCEGLPYLLDAFEITASGTTEKRAQELPLLNSVLSF